MNLNIEKLKIEAQNELRLHLEGVPVKRRLYTPSVILSLIEELEKERRMVAKLINGDRS